MGIKEVQMSKMTEASPLSNYSSQVSATKMLCNKQSQSQRITIGISFLLLGMQVSLTLQGSWNWIGVAPSCQLCSGLFQVSPHSGTRGYPGKFILWQVTEMQKTKPNHEGIFKTPVHITSTNFYQSKQVMWPSPKTMEHGSISQLYQKALEGSHNGRNKDQGTVMQSAMATQVRVIPQRGNEKQSVGFLTASMPML